MSIAQKVCKVDGCGSIGAYHKKVDKYYLTKGYCDKHYWRYHKYGSPTARPLDIRRKITICDNYAKVPLGSNTSDGYAIIDVDMVDEIEKYSWKYTRRYVCASYGRKKPINMRLHHLVIGKPEKGLVVDHINGNPLDNRRSNLRFATIQQNSWNRRKKPTRKYRNITKRKISGNWYVRIVKGGVIHYIGEIKSEKEAVDIYNKLALRLYGEFAVIQEYYE